MGITSVSNFDEKNNEFYNLFYFPDFIKFFYKRLVYLSWEY